ncbi:phage/plasmid primase, P4 family [bacterium]|jgi:phage/plasmid-associated DNA primase|nr:phage/plasmid primase, P4 family [bacterium]
MKLPEQLREDRFGFVKLQRHSKAPFEKGWQKKPYRFKDIEEWLRSGCNYGVMGGVGELVVIDADHKRIGEIVRADIAKTFTVKTPKSGHHFYFLCNDIKRKIVLKKDKEHFGEIISFGSQVVGSGSIHPDTKTAYQIALDIPIINLSQKEIFEPLAEFMMDDKGSSGGVSPEDMDIMTVLNMNGISLKQTSGQYTCTHPVHGSNTGANLVVNPEKNVWKCFRCDSGGGTLLLIAVIEGVIDCSDAKPGMLRGELFKKTVRIAEEKYGFKIRRQSGGSIPSGLWNDEWNAKCLIGRHRERIRNCDNLGGWHLWDGKAWVVDEVHSITSLSRETVSTFYSYLHDMDEDGQKAFLKHIRSSGNETKLKAMANLARSWTKMSIRSDDFDADPYLLNCQNGVVDLKTGTLLPHSPDLLLTKICNTFYDTSAECPEWLKFLDTIFQGNDELVSFIQKAVGYGLTGDVSQQIFFILHGDGANGKSTFVETIYKILGGYAAITPTATLIAKRGSEIPNDVARLKGARFIISSELERSKLLDEALVKRFTSEEPISARFLRQEFFEFKPTGKIFLSTNYKPTIRGTDDGIWRRIRLIPFEHKFEGEERIEKFADKFLLPELPGILAWAVRGLLRMRSEGMKPPEIVMDATQEYKTAEDGVGAFLDEYCDLKEMYMVSVSDLYETFKDNSDFFMKKKDFNDYLEKHGFEKIRGTVGRYKGRYCWKGIQVREYEEDESASPF